jgi:hypothetical protein
MFEAPTEEGCGRGCALFLMAAALPLVELLRRLAEMVV